MVDGESLERKRGDSNLDRAQLPSCKALAGRAVAGTASCIIDVVVLLGHSSVSCPDQFTTASCDVPNSADSVRKLAKEQLFENYQIADDLLVGREFLFDHFTAPDAHFFWCFRRGTQLELDLSAFKNCVAHFERIKKRPSVEKLLAFEKSVQEEFAKAA